MFVRQALEIIAYRSDFATSGVLSVLGNGRVLGRNAQRTQQKPQSPVAFGRLGSFRGKPSVPRTARYARSTKTQVGRLSRPGVMPRADYVIPHAIGISLGFPRIALRFAVSI